MYYNDYNRPQGPWENPIETSGYPVTETPPPTKKKKGGGIKIASLCLACALVGGLAGGGAVALLGRMGAGTTTLLEGVRTPTVVNVAQITGKSPLTIPQIYEANVGASVGITVETVTTNAWGQPVTQAAAGSGFVITPDGYVLTNYHVIKGAQKIQVAFVDGKTYDAKLVGGEEENDIAVLKIEATNLTCVIIGDSDNIRVGEQVVAIGNPLGELTFTLTDGVVSAKDRNITMSDGTVMNMIQTNTAINSGNSGGPLFDIYGQVVGITSAKLSSSTSSGATTIEGLGFAIPINDVKDMVQDIIKNGYVTGKPYMGITVTTIPEAVATQYGIAQGAQVNSVDSASCAEKAGLQVGDIVTAVDKTAITSSAELIAAKNTYKAGATAALTVDRSGVILSLSITFDEDTPARRAAQEEALKTQQEQEQRQQVQQPQRGGQSYAWPFGDLSPWFY